MFLNLLSNAVKFTPAGGTVWLRSGNTSDGRLSVEVRDTGVGIDRELLGRLFDPFEQGEQTITRQFGGLGLGLSITRSLAEMHGGSIRAESEGVGRGAVFTVELPTVAANPDPYRLANSPATVAEPADEAQGSLAASSLRVLLVEDHDDTRNVMSRLLATFGCQVTTASTVREALALAEHQQFDLLVSDIGLPDGSGTEIMRHLRDRQNIRGIALSGFGQSIDLKRSEEAGFETHLIKPVNLRALQDVLRKVAE
jgi:CheY-like chemotaxis protein